MQICLLNGHLWFTTDCASFIPDNNTSTSTRTVYLNGRLYGLDTGMAYRLNLADNRLPIFCQSRLPTTDFLSVPIFYRS